MSSGIQGAPSQKDQSARELRALSSAPSISFIHGELEAAAKRQKVTETLISGLMAFFPGFRKRLEKA